MYILVAYLVFLTIYPLQKFNIKQRVIIALIFAILMGLTYGNRAIEHMTLTSGTNNSEALQNIASLYNGEKLIVDNLKVTGNIEIDGKVITDLNVDKKINSKDLSVSNMGEFGTASNKPLKIVAGDNNDQTNIQFYNGSENNYSIVPQVNGDLIFKNENSSNLLNIKQSGEINTTKFISKNITIVPKIRFIVISNLTNNTNKKPYLSIRGLQAYNTNNIDVALNKKVEIWNYNTEKDTNWMNNDSPKWISSFEAKSKGNLVYYKMSVDNIVNNIYEMNDSISGGYWHGGSGKELSVRIDLGNKENINKIILYNRYNNQWSHRIKNTKIYLCDDLMNILYIINCDNHYNDLTMHLYKKEWYIPFV